MLRLPMIAISIHCCHNSDDDAVICNLGWRIFLNAVWIVNSPCCVLSLSLNSWFGYPNKWDIGAASVSLVYCYCWRFWSTIQNSDLFQNLVVHIYEA